MRISSKHLQQIVQKYYPQATLKTAWKLAGGISAQTIALEITLPDNTIQQIILRQHGDTDRKRNPNIAQDEYKLLNTLYSAGLPVPKPYLVDLSNTILSTPYLLMEVIDGETEFSPTDISTFIPQIIENLVKIHRVDLTVHNLSFLPQHADLIAHRLQSLPPADSRIVDAIRPIFPSLQQMNKSGLLHGDYCLGNILWRNGQWVGVIDWEDAMLGDPLSDLGKSRLEMLWILGEDAMQTYTQHYQKLMPSVDLSHLPFWDLWGALGLSDFADWFDDKIKVNQMREQYTGFVDTAMIQLHKLL